MGVVDFRTSSKRIIVRKFFIGIQVSLLDAMEREIRLLLVSFRLNVQKLIDYACKRLSYKMENNTVLHHTIIHHKIVTL